MSMKIVLKNVGLNSSARTVDSLGGIALFRSTSMFAIRRIPDNRETMEIYTATPHRQLRVLL